MFQSLEEAINQRPWSGVALPFPCLNVYQMPSTRVPAIDFSLAVFPRSDGKVAGVAQDVEV